MYVCMYCLASNDAIMTFGGDAGDLYVMYVLSPAQISPSTLVKQTKPVNLQRIVCMYCTKLDTRKKISRYIHVYVASS